MRSLADIAALADTHRDIAFKVLLKRCVRPVRIENWAQPRFLEGAEAAGVLGQMEAASRALEAMPFRGP